MDHPSKSGTQAKLLHLSPIDVKDELDEKYERCYSYVQNLIQNKSETEAHDVLNNITCKSAIGHEEICLGLLSTILCEPNNAPRLYRDLTYVSRDGCGFVINSLNQLIIDKFPKLQDSVRKQLIWLIREMIKNSLNGVDVLVFNGLRQIAGGDISPRNIWLTESMLDLLMENRSWLETEKHSHLLATVVYTYLRLIVDHGSQHLDKLRHKEIEFCASLLKDRFSDCMAIGRDLVRLLQNVARIPEFEKIWRIMIENPSSLCENFTGILQLMQKRTSRRFLQCRLTPEMEKKMVFLTSMVKLGQQNRYQQWFQRQYLSTPESQSLRCDLVRFICGVIHPSNDVLCSDIIPRWAVIGWMLSTCTSSVAASNAKLSLFYDWLFYHPERDNIMNIEPAILVMFHSMRNHPVITSTLLDFLCRIMTNFHPLLSSQIKQGITTCFHQILEKRVLSSLIPLFECPRLDPELKSLVSRSFPEFCSSNGVQQKSTDEMKVVDGGQFNVCTNHNSIGSMNEAKFSDDDEEESSSSSTILNKKIKEINSIEAVVESNCVLNRGSIPSKSLFNELLVKISPQIATCLESLVDIKQDNERRCENMEKFIQLILDHHDLGQEDLASNLATCLVHVLQDEFTRGIFPIGKENVIDEDALKESIESPLFVLYRSLCETPEEDPNRDPILNLLSEMQIHQKSIGYLMLYYIITNYKTHDDNRMLAYREYAKMVSKDLNSCLLNDLQMCQEDDVNMFCFLLSDIFSEFANIAINNSSLILLIVSCIDSGQLQDLVCHVLQGDLIMFKKDSLLNLLNTSLEWETFEQYCLWQLIAAHNISIDSLLPLLPRLEYQHHAEALTSILLQLKKENPTPELMKHLIGRNIKEHDYFAVSVLTYWMQEHADKLSEIVSNQLMKNSSPVKRKRQANAKMQLNSHSEQLLRHLDEVRQRSKQLSFFNRESIQSGLSHVQSICTELQKTKFSDLLALAEDPLEQKQMNTKKGKNTTKGKTKVKNVEKSSESEESEEEIVPAKVKNSRKKRRIQANNSESD